MSIKIDKGILDLQKKFSLPKDFFKNLLEEDDWSFIIKLHAFIEAACSSLLLFHLDEPGLKKVISRIELSNKSVGKIAFLKEFKLLGDENRRFISSLSELRNNLVHNVENCNISLDKMVSTFNNAELEKFAIDFSPAETILRKFKNPPFKLNDKNIEVVRVVNRAKRTPKFHIWVGAYNLFIAIVDAEGYSEYIKYQKSIDVYKE